MKTKEHKSIKTIKKPVNPFFFVTLFLFLVLIGLNAVGLTLLYQELNQFVDLQARYSSLAQTEDFNSYLLNEEKLAQIEKVFPNEEGIIDFVSTLTQAHALFESFSFSFESDAPLTDKNQPYLPLTLTFSGSLNEAKSFLNQLLNAPYVLEIISLQAKSEDGFVNQAEVIIKANLYVSEEFH